VRFRKTCLSALAAAGPVEAQTTLDRVDPSRIEQSVPREAEGIRAAPTLVEPAAPATSGDAPAGIVAGAIQLEGLTALRPAAFADLFEPFLGRPLSAGDLRRLASAVAERARSKGYPFASATVPPQTLTAGILRVAVDEGRVDAVRITGHDNDAVQAALAPLANGRPVRLAELERRLLIAGDTEGVRVRRTRLVREKGGQVLLVETQRDRVAGSIALHNDGSRPIGPEQAELRLRASQLLTDADSLNLTAVLTPFEPGELTFGALRYGVRVHSGGTELFGTGNWSRTRPGAYLEALDLSGRSWTAGVGVSQPLFRQRAASLWLEAGLTVRRSAQDRDDVRIREDRLTLARLGAFGTMRALSGRLRASVSLTRGLDWFDATEAGDPLASRGDADGRFTSAWFWTDWTGPLVKRVTVRIAVAGQIASGPLLATEEQGLGGAAFLRGYDYSERTGDRAAMGLVELRYATKLAKLGSPELYVFGDGGRTTNFRGGFGSGALASAGGGMRLRLSRNASADVALAVPLTDPRYDTGDKAPSLLFRVAQSF
jgi:hemolysin activation/secretion protein